MFTDCGLAFVVQGFGWSRLPRPGGPIPVRCEGEAMVDIFNGFLQTTVIEFLLDSPISLASPSHIFLAGLSGPDGLRTPSNIRSVQNSQTQPLTALSVCSLDSWNQWKRLV